jgi:hypothetical protein
MKSPKRHSDYLLVILLAGLLSPALTFLFGSRSVSAVTELFRAFHSGSRPQNAAPPTTIGVYRPSNSAFYLRNANTAGAADLIVPFGQSGNLPLTGDWDGNGDDTIGVFRPSNSAFYLRNSNTPGAADIIVQFGQSGDLPIVGDWDGNGTVTIGLYRQGRTFLLRNSNTPGAADITLQFGTLNGSPVYGGAPLAGDWDGNGTVTLGIHKPGTDTFYLRNTLSQGPVDAVITYGQSGADAPVTGDWDGSGTRTIGYYHLSDQSFHLRNANTGGPDDLSFVFGLPGDVPVAGRWTRPNQPPIVDAGPDQTFTLPTNTANLNGTVTDDGLPVGGSLTIEWSKESGPGTVTFGNPQQAMTTATFSAAGSYVLRLTANDSQFAVSDEVTITVNSALAVNAGQDQTVTLPNTALLSGTVSGGAGTVSPEWSKVSGPGPVIFSQASALSASASFSVAGFYVLRLTATDSQTTTSDELAVTVNADPTPPPPAPATIAPPLNTTATTTIGDATEFLYTGPSPIQTGVAPGAINKVRVTALRGRVLDKNSQPLPLVKVSILNHPEFGCTLTQSDGRYDLAVNGGAKLRLKFEKQGLLPIQRQTDAPWQDYVCLSDAVMICVDDRVTKIDLNAATPIQVARASVVTNNTGARQATLLFPQGTTATMFLPGGGMQGLSTLHVRATEYTVGAMGPQMMPGALPPTSAFTYAVALTADEAIAGGVKVGVADVFFNQPVPFYVENFVGIPVGARVPLGFYDPSLAQWAPEPDGRVLKILSVAGGLASLDTNGDGVEDDAATLSALGITQPERQQLATLYAANQTLWRIPLNHFSGADGNYPSQPPADATYANQPPPKQDKKDDDPCKRKGSTIERQNQILGETIGVTGTPFTLNYTSDRVPGRTASNVLTISLSGATLPASLQRIDLEIAVAGQSLRREFLPQPNQTFTYTWDGRDGYGRTLQGQQTAHVKIGYAYDALYQAPPSFPQSFGIPSGISFANAGARFFVVLNQDYKVPMGSSVFIRKRSDLRRTRRGQLFLHLLPGGAGHLQTLNVSKSGLQGGEAFLSLYPADGVAWRRQRNESQESVGAETCCHESVKDCFGAQTKRRNQL